MVPANKIGSSINGGPFNMWQLKADPGSDLYFRLRCFYFVVF